MRIKGHKRNFLPECQAALMSRGCYRIRRSWPNRASSIVCAKPSPASSSVQQSDVPEFQEGTATVAPEPHPKWLRAMILLVAAVTSATATGCLVGPNYRQPFLRLSERWNGVDEIAKPTSGEAPKTDLAQWWRSFNDPLLNQLIAQALASNLDEKIALSRIHEERAYLVISQSGLLPTLNLDGSYTRQRYSANTPFGEFPNVIPREQNMYEAGFDASWELDVFGGIRRGVEASQAELGASIENARDVRITLLAEAARDYVAVRALERRLEIARQNLRDQNDSLKLTEARFEQGYAPELDV